MTSKPEMKPPFINSSPTEIPEAKPKPNAFSAMNFADKFRADLSSLDVQRADLVRNTIENLKPGKPFDPSVVREINKIETRKNRLIVSRFASLLKKGDLAIQAVVHQIIEL